MNRPGQYTPTRADLKLQLNELILRCQNPEVPQFAREWGGNHAAFLMQLLQSGLLPEGQEDSREDSADNDVSLFFADLVDDLQSIASAKGLPPGVEDLARHHIGWLNILVPPSIRSV